MIRSDQIKQALTTAQGIAWDTCHKIYILMDTEEVDKMRGYGYDPLITADEQTPDEMFKTINKWYDDSCELKFIDICETPRTDDPNSGFYQVVPQFADQYDEELV